MIIIRRTRKRREWEEEEEIYEIPLKFIIREENKLDKDNDKGIYYVNSLCNKKKRQITTVALNYYFKTTNPDKSYFNEHVK